MVAKISFGLNARELVVLIGLAVIAGLGVNWVSPKGIALIGEWDTNRGVISAKAKDDVVERRIEIEDVQTAKSIYERGAVLFVDARAKETYEAGHIDGAISLPAGALEAGLGAFLEKYSPTTPIITYCSGRECDDSHQVAQVLKSMGYTQVQVLVDGYPGWRDAGYPVGPK